MCGIEFPSDDSVIIGLNRADDAGVYRITDDIALVQSVDFFTPIVDDPFRFGQIAAANALSDIYAMGGTPKTAMNLVAFPSGDIDLDVLKQILKGGIDKLREADAVLIGGHSVQDRELKYGLSVTGTVHPDRVLGKKNIRPGDRLVLTKPLGTGIVSTALKAEQISAGLAETVTQVMASLNREAAETMRKFDVSACTDVTGFGLLGHLGEMVCGSGAGAVIESQNVPVFREALEYADKGLIPGGSHKNRDFFGQMVSFNGSVARAMQDVLFDAQTSGGLLISVRPDQAESLAASLEQHNAAVIGEILPGPEEKIAVR